MLSLPVKWVNQRTKEVNRPVIMLPWSSGMPFLHFKLGIWKTKRAFQYFNLE